MITTALVLLSLQTDPLAAAFQNPPPSARPHTWWHWMDGNVTKEGITADLEAMKEVGIGGAQMFTVAQGIPKGPVDYMSPKWREMTAHAVKEAGRLGIELCFHNCAGWSSSGGPWITPEYAMQVVAWSKVDVDGGKEIDIQLPQIKAPQVYAPVNYSRDIVVYAVPLANDATNDPQFLGKTGVVRQDAIDPSGIDGPGREKASFIDVTNKVDLDGRLRWQAPAGRWTILRIGHVPTGKDNHPAPPEGDGLEVDKLSREAMDQHWNGIMAKVLGDSGNLTGKVLNNALIDSYEVGGQNWTPKMREEFRKRRGYDPLPYLPAICGMTVGGKMETEKFLWDWRRTIADLFADNYYGYFGELCHKAGIKFSTEPYGNGNFDNIQAGGKADIPMGEFWVGGGTLETTKIAASVGHVYGLPVIGAESFTADEGRGKFLEEPYAAKALGDFVFCNGVNRYIFHRYAHQPWMNLKPGMTMGPWGTHLERTQTWWIEAREWMKYIARCQYLLQSGTFVGDALYYTGETAPTDLPYAGNLKPRLPAGYDYDGCDTEVIMKRLTVKNGRLFLPNGASYAVMFLPESKAMTARVARRVRDLVAAGATIYGPKPELSPSLADGEAGNREVRAIADEVWGKGGTTNTFGKGRMVYGKSTAALMADLKVKPDFEYKSLGGGAKLASIHRRIGDVDAYFVSNQNYRTANVDCTFRVAGKGVELWHGDTGRTERAPVYRYEGGRTTVTLQLGPAESVFVMFRGKAQPPTLTKFGTAVSVGAEKPPAIVIQSARYETADGRGTDVTAVVKEMVAHGDTEIAATNGSFGDPVVNVVKQLTITYSLNGKTYKKTEPENGVLMLLETSNAPASMPGYDLGMNGRDVMITPWKAGSYRAVNASGKTLAVNAPAPRIMDLSKGWNIAFTPGWGAPATARMETLTSWSENSDPGIKYFSGSATYSKEFELSAAPTPVMPVRLDLGKVKNFATVKVNGIQYPAMWKEPFVLDVTKALKKGKNRVEIKITNLWPNRMIGDEQLPPDVEWNGVTLKGWPDWLVKGEPRPKTGRYTFVTWKYWYKDSKLLESGLIGPVLLKTAKRIVIR